MEGNNDNKDNNGQPFLLRKRQLGQPFSTTLKNNRDNSALCASEECREWRMKSEEWRMHFTIVGVAYLVRCVTITNCHAMAIKKVVFVVLPFRQDKCCVLVVLSFMTNKGCPSCPSCLYKFHSAQARIKSKSRTSEWRVITTTWTTTDNLFYFVNDN